MPGSSPRSWSRYEPTRFALRDHARCGITVAAGDGRIADHVNLVAPTLIRSQVLSRLYQQVRDGRMSQPEATSAFDYIRALNMRLLGDRVLQNVAWRIAADLDMADTFDAEYIALTKLQADHLVTDDAALRTAASQLVSVVSIDHLVDHAKRAVADRDTRVNSRE